MIFRQLKASAGSKRSVCFTHSNTAYGMLLRAAIQMHRSNDLQALECSLHAWQHSLLMSS